MERFVSPASLEELIISHMAPGVIGLSALIMMLNTWADVAILNKLAFLHETVIGQLATLVVGSLIVGNVIDALRHYFLDPLGSLLGQHRGPFRPSKADDDPKWEYIGKEGNVHDKIEAFKLIRRHQYHPGEFCCNLGLALFPAAFVAPFYFTMGVLGLALTWIIGGLLSFCLFLIGSIWIKTSDKNCDTIFARQKSAE